jgi:voltage-gated potassium channel
VSEPEQPTAFEDLVPQWLQMGSLVAAVATIPSVILDVVDGLPNWLNIGAAILNWIVWSVFLVTLLWALVRSPHPWKTVNDNPMLPLIVVLTTPIAPAGLQMFRLLRLGALIGAAHHARRLFSLEGLRYAGLILVTVVVGGGVIFAAVEHSAQHLSIEDGIWWAIVTVTTVGYGDIVPHTDAGRGVAVIVMITGIGTAALLVGAASQKFVVGEVSTGDDGEDEDQQVQAPTIADVYHELRSLREEVAQLKAQLSPPGDPPGS